MHFATILMENRQVHQRIDMRLGALAEKRVVLDRLVFFAHHIEHVCQAEQMLRLRVALNGSAEVFDGRSAVTSLLALEALLEVARCALWIACRGGTADDRIQSRSRHCSSSSCKLRCTRKLGASPEV